MVMYVPVYGTYETVDDRPAVRFERRLAHPIDAVWQAVTDPAELAHWFPATVTVDLRPGGAMSFDFGGGVTLDGEVTELDPPRLFAFSWGAEDLRFELEPDDGGAGCRLRFTHVLEERDTAARDAAGWHVCLEALALRLAGQPAPARPSTPAPTSEWRAHYEEYIRRGFPAGAPIPGE
jgi:uncharacterized protein YndB with AHSA1/START domain